LLKIKWWNWNIQRIKDNMPLFAFRKGQGICGEKQHLKVIPSHYAEFEKPQLKEPKNLDKIV